MPNLIVIARPNGAGKSTAAPLLIGRRLGIAEFVNADVIAAGLLAFSPETVALEAGRIMLKRVRQLADEGKDFAFETTLASRSFAPWIAQLRSAHGYRFHLAFLWIPDAETAVQRVAGRVRHGGHSVPPGDIRRRYERGIANFFRLYLPIADSWEMHENSSPPPKLIAMRDGSRPIHISNPELWETVQGHMQTKEKETQYETGAEPRFAGIPISEVMEIFDRAGREALARHKALGIPIVTWRDGKVVVVPPEEIEV
ncbi:MAG: zeta toxin family protein [Betaproteobacteria bacterium]|nr:zeta toxin family protein [Betaproteobacteria bacterium]